MSSYIDLHTHSNASDGTLSPSELIAAAKAAGLKAIALTDHDSVAGIAEAMNAGKTYGVEVVPGIELSTEHHGNEIHMVGLYIDPDSHVLNEALKAFIESRGQRNPKIIALLQQEGFQITPEEVYAANPGSVVSRPHIARYLVDTHQASSVTEVFQKYIGEGCCCFTDRQKITPRQALKLIHEAGGLAVLAHPCMYHMDPADLLSLIDILTNQGLDGIETYYSESTPEQEQYFREIAYEKNLLLSGGSDFHGSNKPQIRLGTGRENLHIPYGVLESLKAKRRYTT